MRKASLTLTLVSLLTGCVGTQPPESPAPSASTDTGNQAPAIVALVLSAPAQLIRGNSAQIVATAVSSDGSRRDATPLVSWTSTSFLTVSVTSGKLFGVGVGSATIRAALGDVTATADVEILPLTLQALTLDADAETAPAGAMISWRVHGHYNDGSAADLTSSAVWQTSDASIATVDQPGEIHTLASGMAMISVAAEGIEVSSPMMVTQ